MLPVLYQSLYSRPPVGFGIYLNDDIHSHLSQESTYFPDESLTVWAQPNYIEAEGTLSLDYCDTRKHLTATYQDPEIASAPCRIYEKPPLESVTWTIHRLYDPSHHPIDDCFFQTSDGSATIPKHSAYCWEFALQENSICVDSATRDLFPWGGYADTNETLGSIRSLWFSVSHAHGVTRLTHHTHLASDHQQDPSHPTPPLQGRSLEDFINQGLLKFQLMCGPVALGQFISHAVVRHNQADRRLRIGFIAAQH